MRWKMPNVKRYFMLENIPITEIVGEGEKTAVILAGVHPGEYTAIAACSVLVERLTHANVLGTIKIVHCANIPGFFAKVSAANPVDGKNLNRAFPGDKHGTITQKIAYALEEELFFGADMLLDLHGGDLHEDLMPMAVYAVNCSEAVRETARNIAESFGFGHVAGMDFPPTTIGRGAALGIPSVVTFLGGRGLVIDEEVETYANGVINALTASGFVGGEVKRFDNSYFNRLAPFTANVSGLWRPCVSPGDFVTKNQLIGTITDFFGDTLTEYRAKYDAQVICVVTSLAINENDLLFELDR